MAEIDKYFKIMVEQKTSDLHITVGCKPMFRKDGSMVALKAEPELTPESAERLLFEITPPKNLEEYQQRNDTDFAYQLDGFGRFRANLFRDNRGTGGVFRLIPSVIQTFEDLKSPPVLKKFCTLHKGLVLVTGPTGSGKSTTLAAMINFINETRQDHIITIEDPIEFVHPSKRCLINQREVHTHTLGFKPALRAALREDPDIVLVGEMRDLETTHIAIETAETGHLVFGTLHTTTAISTVDRLIDQFSADQQAQIRLMLSNALKGVVAQNLLKRKGGGRVAALEILVVTPAVQALIREAKTSQIMSIMQTAKKEGMTLLNEELARFVKEEVIEFDEAYSKAADKDGFCKTCESQGLTFTRPADW
jgi:twitching motility protein PilT